MDRWVQPLSRFPQWGIELSTFGLRTRDLNHSALQRCCQTETPTIPPYRLCLLGLIGTVVQQHLYGYTVYILVIEHAYGYAEQSSTWVYHTTLSIQIGCSMNQFAKHQLFSEINCPSNSSSNGGTPNWSLDNLLSWTTSSWISHAGSGLLRPVN